MTTLNLDFNQVLFTNYYSSIGGNLYKTNFYSQLIQKFGGDPTTINNMLGVNDPTVDFATIDTQLFYNNWSSKDQALAYASQINAALFSGTANIGQAWALLQNMSGFMIQFYFFVKRDINSVLPKIVGYSKPGYYQQTNNFYTFFRSNLVRGAGNVTINSMCQQLVSFVDGDENKRTYISKSPNLLGWCGCFAPLDPISVASGVDVPQECDTLCVNQSAIKLWELNGVNPEPLECQSAVCVMSGISLNVQESTDRIYNFNQICTACEDNKEQPCRCVIDSDFASLLTKIQAGDSGMDVSTIFNQYCPNAICVITDYTQEGTRIVDCNSLNPAASGLGTENYATGDITYTFDVGINSGTVSLIVLFVLLPLIFLCFIVIIKDSQEIKVK